MGQWIHISWALLNKPIIIPSGKIIENQPIKDELIGKSLQITAKEKKLWLSIFHIYKSLQKKKTPGFWQQRHAIWAICDALQETWQILFDQSLRSNIKHCWTWLLMYLKTNKKTAWKKGQIIDIQLSRKAVVNQISVALYHALPSLGWMHKFQQKYRAKTYKNNNAIVIVFCQQWSTISQQWSTVVNNQQHNFACPPAFIQPPTTSHPGRWRHGPAHHGSGHWPVTAGAKARRPCAAAYDPSVSCWECYEHMMLLRTLMVSYILRNTSRDTNIDVVWITWYASVLYKWYLASIQSSYPNSSG